MTISDLELEKIVERRSRLIQFLILVIASIQGVVLYAVLSGRNDWTIPAAIVVALVTCVYAAVRERKLSDLHSVLFKGLASRKRQVESEKKGRQKLQLRLGEMTALYRSISQVNAVPHVEGVYDSVIGAALELVEGDVGSLMLYDEPSDRLVLTVGRGLPKQAVIGSRQPANSGVAGWVLSQNQPLLLEGDASNDGRFSTLIKRGKGVRSSLCIPLILHGERLGVLNLGLSDRAEKQELTELDRSLAAIFAQHAAASVLNARTLSSSQGVLSRQTA
ncbi:MAG: GAF domain-containing protein [Acidobacteriota bacterium]